MRAASNSVSISRAARGRSASDDISETVRDALNSAGALGKTKARATGCLVSRFVRDEEAMEKDLTPGCGSCLT